MRIITPLLLLSLLALAACAERDDVPPPADEPAFTTADDAAAGPQDAWWANMQRHCGNAYEGSLGHAPPDDDMLEGDELLIVHFRECDDHEMRLPFHIERMDGTWDRSRTWIYTRTDEGIELRHDHRQEDGSPDEVTNYGGHTEDEGTPDYQRFIFTERTGPEGETLGWRVEIAPDDHYVYGTFRGDEWSWRVDFDLSQAVAPPPAPWGYEDGRPD
jgi:hypothetical protein